MLSLSIRRNVQVTGFSAERLFSLEAINKIWKKWKKCLCINRVQSVICVGLVIELYKIIEMKTGNVFYSLVKKPLFQGV